MNGSTLVCATSSVNSQRAAISCATQLRAHFAYALVGTNGVDALTTTLNEAGDARAQLITSALVLGAHDTRLGCATWRNPNAGAEPAPVRRLEVIAELEEVDLRPRADHILTPQRWRMAS